MENMKASSENSEIIINQITQTKTTKQTIPEVDFYQDRKLSVCVCVEKGNLLIEPGYSGGKQIGIHGGS